ncbi:hypothetical protein HOC01_06420 [archaeon]|jgi:hypothetical protein|nr:hypothetical protein [archaeon]MBT6697525.1 hypothetical protein [archaeon]
MVVEVDFSGWLVSHTVQQFLEFMIFIAFIAALYYLVQFFSFQSEEDKKESQRKLDEASEEFKEFMKSKGFDEKAHKAKQELADREKYLIVARHRLLETIDLCGELYGEALPEKTERALSNAKSLAKRIRSKLHDTRRNVRITRKRAHDNMEDILKELHTRSDYVAKHFQKNVHDEMPKTIKDPEWDKKIKDITEHTRRVENYCGALVKAIGEFIQKVKFETANIEAAEKKLAKDLAAAEAVADVEDNTAAGDQAVAQNVPTAFLKSSEATARKSIEKIKDEMGVPLTEAVKQLGLLLEELKKGNNLTQKTVDGFKNKARDALALAWRSHHLEKATNGGGNLAAEGKALQNALGALIHNLDAIDTSKENAVKTKAHTKVKTLLGRVRTLHTKAESLLSRVIKRVEKKLGTTLRFSFR